MPEMESAQDMLRQQHAMDVFFKPNTVAVSVRPRPQAAWGGPCYGT